MRWLGCGGAMDQSPLEPPGNLTADYVFGLREWPPTGTAPESVDAADRRGGCRPPRTRAGRCRAEARAPRGHARPQRPAGDADQASDSGSMTLRGTRGRVSPRSARAPARPSRASQLPKRAQATHVSGHAHRRQRGAQLDQPGTQLGRGERIDRPRGAEADDEALANHAVPDNGPRRQALGRLAGAEGVERRAQADGGGQRSDSVSRSPRSAVPLRRRISGWVGVRVSGSVGAGRPGGPRGPAQDQMPTHLAPKDQMPTAGRSANQMLGRWVSQMLVACRASLACGRRRPGWPQDVGFR